MSEYGTCPRCGGMTIGVITTGDFLPAISHVCRPTGASQYIAKLEADLAEWKLRALTVESSEEDAQQAAVRFKAERDKLRAILQGVRWAITFEANGDGGWGKRIDYALQETKP